MREDRMTRGLKRPPRRWAIALVTLGLVLGSMGSGVGIAAKKGVTKKKADRKFLQNTTIVQQNFPVVSDQVTPLSVPCPPGFQAVGGGVDSPSPNNPNIDMIATEQRPILSGSRATGWYVEAAGQDAGASVTVYAVCSK
jgi:hypothetical protein